MAEAILSVQGLCKHYPGFDLREIAFELPRGYIMGLIGPNGAGKTTIIRIIMDLARADQGRIKVCGLDSREAAREVKYKVGYVAEEQNFYSNMTVAWTAGFAGWYYPAWDQAFFMELLGRYGIDPGKKTGALSKGMRVMFALALALAHRPELLILDEPAAGLDPVARREILSELMAFVQDENRSVLISSHHTQDIEKIADYITLVVAGRVVESGEKEDLLARYGGPDRTASIDDILFWIVKGEK